ncbi:stabilin-2-like [Salvelinus sp. IW2-2015]|uniref:stabilin-2-like n=1 Tax=Salvelinus sp. IW2-2015 TaxID=2691554 RepID=UPI0038D43277
MSESGKQSVKRLSNLTIQSTLFIPDNTGLYQNQTLTHRDMEYHLSEGRALALKDLTNGSCIRTQLGQSLIVMGIADFLNPKALSSSRYINDRFIVDSRHPGIQWDHPCAAGTPQSPTPLVSAPRGSQGRDGDWSCATDHADGWGWVRRLPLLHPQDQTIPVPLL